MEYLAHKTDDGRAQTISDHLSGTAALAQEYAADIVKSAAFAVAMAHDIGKYAAAFQKRLDGGKERYEHSVCGAIELEKLMSEKADSVLAPMLQFCVAGHHTGLPDGGSLGDNEEMPTLCARLNRKGCYTGSWDYSVYKDYEQIQKPDISAIFREIAAAPSPQDRIELYSFFTRYIFSCLTDADFIDTERFCKPDVRRAFLKCDFAKASEELEKEFVRLKPDTKVRAARFSLQRQAYSNVDGDSHVSILNMPTGSGKTLCSLKIALDKVLASKGTKKRIIYVIPYTGIIEQTAEKFEKLFGKHVDILQHHSNYTFAEDRDGENANAKLKLATENWDAPFVITTSVQFFQSVCHYKGSSLRKLHNMGNSVIVFDEIHMLPVKFLQPCLRAVGYITKYLNSEAIFMSATMPDYSGLFKSYLPYCRVNELITDKSDFGCFKTCKYINMGKTDADSVIAKADAYNRSLIIVNSRKTAREIYRRVQGRKYHLSTYMTPVHRSAVIEAIVNDLKNKVKITVVSTSLVEAGVDLDFEAVFRQLAGLDSILQSGGRCNREGLRNSGFVYIFETDEQPKKELQIRINATRRLLKEYEDITEPQCIESYYRTIFDFSEEAIEKNSIYRFGGGRVTNPAFIPFKSYAEDFTFIKDDSMGVVVNMCDDCNTLVQRLSDGDFSAKRELQKYTVPLKIHGEFSEALSRGIIGDDGTGVYMLKMNEYYDEETGLDMSRSFDMII